MRLRLGGLFYLLAVTAGYDQDDEWISSLAEESTPVPTAEYAAAGDLLDSQLQNEGLAMATDYQSGSFALSKVIDSPSKEVVEMPNFAPRSEAAMNSTTHVFYDESSSGKGEKTRGKGKKGKQSKSSRLTKSKDSKSFSDSKRSRKSRKSSKSSKLRKRGPIGVPTAFVLCYDVPLLTSEPTDEVLDDLLEVTTEFYSRHLKESFKLSEFDFEEMDLHILIGESVFEAGRFCAEFIGTAKFEYMAPSPGELADTLSQVPLDKYITDFLEGLDSAFQSTEEVELLDFFLGEPTAAPSPKIAEPTIAPTARPSTSRSPTLVPSKQPTMQPTTPVPSKSPSTSPSNTPTLVPSQLPSILPSKNPSQYPSSSPVASGEPSTPPSQSPSSFPIVGTREPSSSPSQLPSLTPSVGPSLTPSRFPSSAPGIGLSERPSLAPSHQPSLSPSRFPSSAPGIGLSEWPSLAPSHQPSLRPSQAPSLSPSWLPSTTPSRLPSRGPSQLPSLGPSQTPSAIPSVFPSRLPSIEPSQLPSLGPSQTPSMQLGDTSQAPSAVPSIAPSLGPSLTPSSAPSQLPSLAPSQVPSAQPSRLPSVSPSQMPSMRPSSIPSSEPSLSPSSAPSLSINPSAGPSQEPSFSVQPSLSSAPSAMPSSSEKPTLSSVPSVRPSILPSQVPSHLPSSGPSLTPSVVPSHAPSSNPSMMPATAKLFEIDLDLSNVANQYQATFSTASDRWEEIIIGDLAPAPTTTNVIQNSKCKNIPSVIDDVHICAFVEPIDGPTGVLGSAQPEFARNNILPTVGFMRFDSADVDRLVTDGEFDLIILHEMGHVVGRLHLGISVFPTLCVDPIASTLTTPLCRKQLGLGSLWPLKGLSNSFTPPCAYIANSKATAEYQALSGCTTAVPIEQGGGTGTQCSHWAEFCLQDELMTGARTGGLPLSRVTVGSLEDLGYSVDYSKVDSFSASDLDANCRCNNVVEEWPARQIHPDKNGQATMYKVSDLISGFMPATTKWHRKKRRKISPEGKKAAMAYGKKLLKAEAERKVNLTDTGDQVFIGDQLVMVLYYEEGEVYGVDVWSDEP